MLSCPTCGKENAPHRERCVHCGGLLNEKTGSSAGTSDQDEEHTELPGGFNEDEHTQELAEEHADDDATQHFDTGSLDSDPGAPNAPSPRVTGSNAGPLEIDSSFGARCP